MKVLILTQKVDSEDDVLGFFHGWIKSFSDVFDKLTVICLERGKYDVPSSVVVHSLGKEHKKSRVRYILRFFSLIWKERKNYDAVLVHMNKEYIVLGGMLWRLWGKKIAFWYNHPQGTVSARIAGLLAHKIFYTSSYSFFNASPKAEQMPVGIDTDLFKPSQIKKQNAVLSLGRIAPIKYIHNLIAASKDIDMPVHVYGSALPRDAEYFEQVKHNAMSERVTFHGSVPNSQAAALFQKYQFFVNLTPTGSFDKSIVEAMSSGCIVLAVNESYKDMLPVTYHKLLMVEANNSDDLVRKINHFQTLPEEEILEIAKKLREIAIERHSLQKLSQDLSSEIKMLFL